MTASRPFCELVGRWRSLVETASPFSRTAAILEVVAPLSVPMKIFSLMSARQVADGGRQRQELFAFRRQSRLTSRVTAPETFLNLLRGDAPILALAPMQDVTTLQFMRVIARYGGPDVYWTEYFRVHGDSRPEKWILDSITKNPTGRPVVAQIIGNDIPALVRNAKLLQKYPVAAIDLNLGCPAPIVYRKCAGGGLLREPRKD